MEDTTLVRCPQCRDLYRIRETHPARFLGKLSKEETVALRLRGVEVLVQWSCPDCQGKHPKE